MVIRVELTFPRGVRSSRQLKVSTRAIYTRDACTHFAGNYVSHREIILFQLRSDLAF